MTGKEFQFKLHEFCEQCRPGIALAELTAALEMEKFFWLQDSYTVSATIARAIMTEAAKDAKQKQVAAAEERTKVS